MKVKIIKATSDKWYYTFIGNIYKVATNNPVSTYSTSWWLVDDGQSNTIPKLLLAEDCEVIKENNNCDSCKYGIKEQNNNLPYCNKIHVTDINFCWEPKDEEKEKIRTFPCYNYSGWKPKEQFKVGDKVTLKKEYYGDYDEHFSQCYLEIKSFLYYDTSRFFDTYYTVTSWPLNHFELYNPKTYQFKVGDYVVLKEKCKKYYLPRYHTEIFKIEELVKDGYFFSKEDPTYEYLSENFELAPIEKVDKFLKEKEKEKRQVLCKTCLKQNICTTQNITIYKCAGYIQKGESRGIQEKLKMKNGDDEPLYYINMSSLYSSLNNTKGKPKIKKVVKEYSKKLDEMLTYEMLSQKNACKKSMTFLFSAIYEDFHRTELYMTTQQLIDYLDKHQRNPDIKWVKENFCMSNNLEEVLIRNCNGNKIYAFYNGGYVYKLFGPSPSDIFWINLSDTVSYINSDMQTMIDRGHIIYEFDNQQEFFKWALEQCK